VVTLAGKLAALCMACKGIKSEHFQIWKKYQNSEIIGILPLFSDYQNSTFKYP
jgi:hypothetical protein